MQHFVLAFLTVCALLAPTSWCEDEIDVIIPTPIPDPPPPVVDPTIPLSPAPSEFSLFLQPQKLGGNFYNPSDINRYCTFHPEVSAAGFELGPGDVLFNAPKVYLIWVGSWTAEERQIVDYFVEHFTADAWIHSASSASYGSSGKYTADTVTLAGSYLIPSANFHSIEAVVQTIRSTAVQFGFPLAGDAIYLVIPTRRIPVSPSVSLQSCGWHNTFYLDYAHNPEIQIKYGMIFDTDACRIQDTYPIVESSVRSQVLVNTVAHEIVEVMTDPIIPQSWVNPDTLEENADMCRYCFGDTQLDDRGAMWNMEIGPYKLRYLIQQNYDPRSGTCVSVSPRNTDKIICGATNIETTEQCSQNACTLPNSVCVEGVCQCQTNSCFVQGECHVFPAPPVSCPIPSLNEFVSLSQNGEVVTSWPESFPIDTTLQVSCEAGYTANVKSVRCMTNGLWSDVPTCSVPTHCPAYIHYSLLSADSRFAKCLRRKVGQTCRATCPAAHTLLGDSAYVCGQDGQWAPKSGKPCAYNCVEGVRFGDSLYLSKTKKMAYADAEKFCQSWAADAYVATVESEAENDFLTNSMLRYHAKWLGISRADSNSEYKNADGTSLTYSNWANGQASSVSGENCARQGVELQIDSEWSSLACTNKAMVVCERPVPALECQPPILYS